MKNPRLNILILVTGLCAAFVLGFFLGKNQNHGPVHLTPLPETAANASAVSVPDAVLSGDPSRIDLNSASAEDFMSLPGIGEVLAQRIIAYREEHGGFQSVEELIHVDGIGEKRIEELLDLITIGGS